MVKKYFSGLSRNTFFLSLASLFGDISSEMLYPVLPIYLTQVLKSSGSIIGIIEGVATATQNIIQGFSGSLSDKLQRRKPVALLGYTLSAVAKPFIGVASSWPGVLGARFMDRLGAGTRSAPRDALVAASVDDAHRGKAFGLEGFGDNLGAFLGPIVTVVLLFFLHVPIRSIFYFAIIPGLCTVIVMLLVHEKRIHIAAKSKLEAKIVPFPPSYWRYLLVTALFGIGNSSNAFLILQTRNVGVPLQWTILIYAAFNLIAALASYPSGFLSDRLGRKRILLVSFFIFMIVYFGFGVTKNFLLIALLFGLYGVYQGIFRAVGKAYASDFVPAHLRASSIGWYSSVVGLSGLIASVVAGYLWDHSGHQSVFFYGVASALIGSVALLVLIPKTAKSQVL